MDNTGFVFEGTRGPADAVGIIEPVARNSSSILRRGR